MERYIEKGGRRLRLGYTTGSCAAAAAKAAAWMLLTGKQKENISIQTPKGIFLNLEVKEISIGKGCVSCAVEKDSGDDPDVTNKMLVFASVSYKENSGISIDGGQGIGRVTKPGLDQPVGSAAINSVPRRMIQENVEEICRLADYYGGLSVVISVPGGEEIAQKTFNPRLGIVGGISILGTTGIVEPMSDGALIDTIHTELNQRRALGAEYVLLTPGNYGCGFICDTLKLSPERAVMTSNFIGDALDTCKELGFKGALLVGHIGKMVKLAGGMFNTHSQYGDCRMEILTAQAALCGIRPEKAAEVMEAAVCDDALRVLWEEGIFKETMERLTQRIAYYLHIRAGTDMEIGTAFFSKGYGLLGKTENMEFFIDKIKE
jgi:cobalt-precorrin-5B (C1)-methyltransferase